MKQLNNANKFLLAAKKGSSKRGTQLATQEAATLPTVPTTDSARARRGQGEPTRAVTPPVPVLDTTSAPPPAIVPPISTVPTTPSKRPAEAARSERRTRSRAEKSEDSASGSHIPSWQKQDFHMPESQEKAGKLVNEISAVPDLDKLNIYKRGGYPATVGVGMLKRLHHDGVRRRCGEHSSSVLMGEVGFCMSEMATKVTLVYDRLMETVNSSAILASEKNKLEEQVNSLRAELKQNEETVTAKVTELSKVEEEKKTLEAHLDLSKKSEEVALKNISSVRKELKTSTQQLQESKTEIAELKKKVAELSQPNDEQKQAIIAEYKSSSDFATCVEDEAYPFYLQGVNHVLRQVACSGLDVKADRLAEWGTNAPFCPSARSGHALVPYNEDELTSLAELDAQKGLPAWVPPEIAVPTITDLMTQIWMVQTQEATTIAEHAAGGTGEVITIDDGEAASEEQAAA